METFRIPEGFVRTITEVYGPTGVEWLIGLPALVADCARRWSLTVLPPFEPLSYNYVAPALRADGTDVVLKLGVPNPELLTEINALRFYGGHGSVQLLDFDREQGVLLLERLNPGTPLSRLADDGRATSIAVQVMKQLWRPAPAEHAFPSIAQWTRGLQRYRDRFRGGRGPLPTRLVNRAERLFAELIASSTEPVLLHGDLHHENILAAQRQPWLALDPKGVIGEPAAEVGPLLLNPRRQLLARAQPGRLLARRVSQLAEELGVARERIAGWGLAQAMLSACWSVEDHGYGWEWDVACARLIGELT